VAGKERALDGRGFHPHTNRGAALRERARDKELVLAEPPVGGLDIVQRITQLRDDSVAITTTAGVLR
jgi:hypothetical protein